MREITFEATFEVPHNGKCGLILKDAEGHHIQVVSDPDWVAYFHLFITRKGTVVMPYPLGFSLAPALAELGVEVVRAELMLKKMEGDLMAHSVLVLKAHDCDQEVLLQTRASEAVMICLQSDRPIFAHDNFIWHGSPQSFFEEVSPQDFVSAYNRLKGISP